MISLLPTQINQCYAEKHSTCQAPNTAQTSSRFCGRLCGTAKTMSSLGDTDVTSSSGMVPAACSPPCRWVSPTTSSKLNHSVGSSGSGLVPRILFWIILVFFLLLCYGRGSLLVLVLVLLLLRLLLLFPSPTPPPLAPAQLTQAKQIDIKIPTMLSEIDAIGAGKTVDELGIILCNFWGWLASLVTLHCSICRPQEHLWVWC